MAIFSSLLFCCCCFLLVDAVVGVGVGAGVVVLVFSLVGSVVVTSSFSEELSLEDLVEESSMDVGVFFVLVVLVSSVSLEGSMVTSSSDVLVEDVLLFVGVVSLDSSFISASFVVVLGALSGTLSEVEILEEGSLSTPPSFFFSSGMRRLYLRLAGFSFSTASSALLSLLFLLLLFLEEIFPLGSFVLTSAAFVLSMNPMGTSIF
mmetsp:Transcript_42881/g.62782  ORF Transcript_42881/g.62782 Transcript_42881/m.62782 type:complete len:205 (-) Transcript_42881:1604-2218(-)